jgi:hypothetical protein
MIMKRLQDSVTRVIFGKDPKVTKATFAQLIDTDMSGKEVPMSNYLGSVVLVTNVASE